MKVRSMGRKGKTFWRSSLASGTGNKSGGGVSWHALSKVEETASQETMERQVMKFKAELVKEEGVHEYIHGAEDEAAID